MKRLTLLGGLLLAAALVLTACGGNSGTASSSKDFNDQDVTFAQSMIPHHEQAIEMAKMAKTQASSAEVKNLATKIEDAQGPEISTMTGWLKSWGKDVPSDSMSGMDGMDMGDSSSMPGMMSADDMKVLKNAKGADFDRLFLERMIKHHEGAIEMAKTEQSKGQNADAVQLAQDIADAQASEISEMKGLLSS